MVRSSFCDNPLLRVSRPVSACSRCRSAKVKCDGKLPACTACEKAGRESECSAANDQFARGKERSYVAALELRIEKLERRLEYAKRRKDSVSQHDSEAPPVAMDSGRKDSLANIRAAIHRKEARNRENSDVNSLLSDFGALTINATIQDFEPSASNMTFARLVLAAATNDPMPPSKTQTLPPRQTGQAIVQYYLTYIHALYPLFSESHVLGLLEDLYKPDGARPARRSVDHWLIYMVLAIGSTAQSQTTTDDFYVNGVEFASRALEQADRALAPGRIHQIQSLFLLTQYSMLDPAHFDSWHLIGFTCRAVVDLGFHQDPPQTSQVDKRGLLDLRRKTFYCVYALDRSISMINTLAFSFMDDAINVDLPSMSGIGRIPSHVGPINGPQSSDPAILLFQLRRIQSHWYQVLFQSDPSQPLTEPASYLWQMCQEMREWYEALPETLPPGIRDLFDLELNYSYVYCISPSDRAPQPTVYGRMLIFEYVISYVDRIYNLSHGPHNAAFYTYHDVLRVLFMGNQFVGVLQDASDALLTGMSIPVPLSLPGKAPPPPVPSRSSGDNIDRAILCIERLSMTLRKYGERWEYANSLAEAFDMISNRSSEDLKTRRTLRDAAQNQVRFQQNQSPPGMPQITPQMMAQAQFQGLPVSQGMPVPQSLPVSQGLPVSMPALPQMMHAQPLPGQMMHGPPLGAQPIPTPAVQAQQMRVQQMAVQQQLQARQQQQQQDVKWVDVDIQKLMRGGGM